MGPRFCGGASIANRRSFALLRMTHQGWRRWMSLQWFRDSGYLGALRRDRASSRDQTSLARGPPANDAKPQ